MRRVFIGIDIGTTKIGAVALDSTSGKLLAVASALNASKVKQKGGIFEQDAEKIIKITFSVIRKLIASGKFSKRELKGVGITGQMHGVVLLDKNLIPLTNLVTWQDKRCDALFPEKKYSYIEEMKKRMGKAAINDSGCMPATGYMGATLFWYGVNKKLPKDVKAAFIHDYLGARLTGEKTIYTDPTDAGSSGVFNARKREWNRTALKKLGIPEEVLPKIRKSGEIIGKSSGETEKLTSLPYGTPVTCAIGDNQASILGGLSELKKDAVLVNIGTGSQLSILSKRFIRVPGVDTRCFVDSRYALVGAGLSGGDSYRVLSDFFASTVKLFAGRKVKEQLYKKMNRLAARGELSGLSCDTQFLGTRLSPLKRGAIKCISPRNFTPENLSLAVLDGIAEELYLYYLEILKTGAKRPLLVMATGNAVKKNRLLQRIIAEKFGLPLKLTPFNEEACYGAAFLASQTTK